MFKPKTEALTIDSLACGVDEEAKDSEEEDGRHQDGSL